MRTLLLIPLLLLPGPSSQTPPAIDENVPVKVVSFKWSKTRLTTEQAKTSGSAPAAAMIPQNRNFERNRRANTSPGERDPNLDTIDGRSAALENSVQESRASKPVEGFEYNVKIQNASKKVITAIIWEYQFKEALNPANVSGRQFLCGVSIKPEKGQDFRVVSTKGPSEVVSVVSLANKSRDLFHENVLINFVEFADGSYWQRSDWDSAAARRAFDAQTVKEKVSSLCFGI